MTTLYNFYEDDLPQKFIAIFSDGSGCDIYWQIEPDYYRGASFTKHHLQKDWFEDAGYLWFIPLPDDFEVWCENEE